MGKKNNSNDNDVMAPVYLEDEQSEADNGIDIEVDTEVEEPKVDDSPKGEVQSKEDTPKGSTPEGTLSEDEMLKAVYLKAVGNPLPVNPNKDRIVKHLWLRKYGKLPYIGRNKALDKLYKFWVG